MKPFFSGSFFLFLFLCASVLFSEVAYTADSKAKMQIEHVLVFGDSVPDGNGPFSTWKLLNTLKGNTVDGKPMLNLLPFLSSACQKTLVTTKIEGLVNQSMFTRVI